MKEIKLRAWDYFDEKMYLVNSIEFHHFTQTTNMWINLPNGDKLAPKSEGGHCELMQDTGLKDKNGKEIYEGDIVRFSKEHRDSMVVFNHHQGAFMFRWIGFHDDAEDFMHATYFSELHPDRVEREVIGNIYENKELLKD